MTAADHRPLLIATRASRLALWQAQHVAGLIRAAASGSRNVQLVEVSTAGDRDLSEPLAQMGGLGVFTREVQHAVLDGRADLAVHSLKDLPTTSTPGLMLAGIPTRGPRFDVLVLPVDAEALGNVEELPARARIGTGSLRRRAQLLHARPDLVMCDVRGNVETRLRKLDEEEYDALVLAEAGLERLDLGARVSLRLTPPLMLPAVGQAALGIECRSDDKETCTLLSHLSDASTQAEVTAERACLAALRAGCHAPVGMLVQLSSADAMTLEGVVLSTDGQQRIHTTLSGSPAAAEQLGQQLADELRSQGADELLHPPR